MNLKSISRSNFKGFERFSDLLYFKKPSNILVRIHENKEYKKDNARIPTYKIFHSLESSLFDAENNFKAFDNEARRRMEGILNKSEDMGMAVLGHYMYAFYQKYLNNKKINGYILSLILNIASYGIGLLINKIIY